MPKGSLNVSLKGADDIFSTEESRQEQQREQVQQIPIGELFPFKNHPFKVLVDESMILLANPIPSPTKRSIWKITPKRTASRTSAILQMMAFQV